MDGYIFCRTVSNEASAEKIIEAGNTVPFVDIIPKFHGHSLVVPKRHVLRFSELDDELSAEIFKMTKQVVKAFEKALKPDAFKSA